MKTSFHLWKKAWMIAAVEVLNIPSAGFPLNTSITAAIRIDGRCGRDSFDSFVNNGDERKTPSRRGNRFKRGEKKEKRGKNVQITPVYFKTWGSFRHIVYGISQSYWTKLVPQIRNQTLKLFYPNELLSGCTLTRMS